MAGDCPRTVRVACWIRERDCWSEEAVQQTTGNAATRHGISDVGRPVAAGMDAAELSEATKTPSCRRCGIDEARHARTRRLCCLRFPILAAPVVNATCLHAESHPQTSGGYLIIDDPPAASHNSLHTSIGVEGTREASFVVIRRNPDDPARRSIRAKRPNFGARQRACKAPLY